MATCKHLYIKHPLYGVVKCEHCGAIKPDPASVQAALQESAQLNKEAK